MKRRFRGPTPAFVISLIALFVALGGTTYAATSLPANSVGTKQLKNRAVTSKKVAPKLIVFGAKAALVAEAADQANHAIEADHAKTTDSVDSLGGYKANELSRVDYSGGGNTVDSGGAPITQVSMNAPHNGYIYVHADVGTTDASPTAKAVRAWIAHQGTAEHSLPLSGVIATNGTSYVGSVSVSYTFAVTQGFHTFVINGAVDGGTAPLISNAFAIYTPFDYSGITH